MRTNEIRVEMKSCGENEKLARYMVTGFVAGLDPTLTELSDVKTAVSEAVTNAILHGYQNGPGTVVLSLKLQGRTLEVQVEDTGIGMENVEKAMEPMYSTRPEWERSGMGFAFMEAFMDLLKVESVPGKGTKVTMKKTFREP